MNTVTDTLIVRSPGRVNIIGEHTDYNEGYVLPVAIDRGVSVSITLRDDDEIHLFSDAHQEQFVTKLDDVRPVKGWPDYVLGVFYQLQKHGYAMGGCHLQVKGDIPIGAGLSSSAAVECASIFALKEAFGHELTTWEMVRFAQAAEHHFAGVRCGIMDQFASMFGKKDFAMQLDCRKLEFEYVPLSLGDYKIVLFNTNVNHSLSSSEYNTRRAQCEQGVAWVAEKFPDVRSLRDVRQDMLDEIAAKDAIVYKRCRYVIDENNRLLKACTAMRNGELGVLGQLMFQSHNGLSKAYEVSCRELDLLVEQVRDHPAVLGARMMGGGFGGCTINLVKEDAIGQLAEQLSETYLTATGIELSVYIAGSDNGTRLL